MQYAVLKKDALLQLIRGRNLHGYSRLNKPELIAMLVSNDALLGGPQPQPQIQPQIQPWFQPQPQIQPWVQPRIPSPRIQPQIQPRILSPRMPPQIQPRIPSPRIPPQIQPRILSPRMPPQIQPRAASPRLQPQRAPSVVMVPPVPQAEDPNILNRLEPREPEAAVRSQPPAPLSPKPNATTTCMICYEVEVAQRDYLKCGHAICVNCLSLLRKLECPIDRRPLEGPLINQAMRQAIQKRELEDKRRSEAVAERVAQFAAANPEMDITQVYGLEIPEQILSTDTENLIRELIATGTWSPEVQLNLILEIRQQYPLVTVNEVKAAIDKIVAQIPIF